MGTRYYTIVGKAGEAAVLKGELEDQKKVMNRPPEAMSVPPGAGPAESQGRSRWQAVPSTPGGGQGWEWRIFRDPSPLTWITAEFPNRSP